MSSPFKYHRRVVLLPLFFLLMLWLVYGLGVRYGLDLVVYGIFPRSLSGLQGVVFSPFIHASLSHLYNNSLALVVLLAALAFFYAQQSFKVVILGIFMSGFLTWTIGRPNYHVGASGLVYVLFGFVFFKGILTKYYRLVALSLTVVVVYGGMIWYVFPKVDDAISWEGHLSGLLTGLFLALFIKIPVNEAEPKYSWQQPDFDPRQDSFMRQFDEQGNFINPEPKPETGDTPYFVSDANVNYTIVPEDSKE